MGTYHKVFHIDLFHSKPDQDYRFYANGKSYPLTRHDENSLAKAREEEPELAKIPNEALTHYTPEEVPMPTDRVIRVHVDAMNEEGIKIMYRCALHLPERDADLLATMGTPIHHPEVLSYTTTSKMLVSMHPDVQVSPLDLTNHSIIQGHVNAATSIQLMVNEMMRLGDPGLTTGWAHLSDPVPVPTWQKGPQPKIDFSQPFSPSPRQHNPVPSVLKAGGHAMKTILGAINNDSRLQNKKWVVQEGTSVVSEEGLFDRSIDGWSASLDKSEQIHGLKSSLSNTGTNRQVKLKMENYFVRYLCGYIEFLNADYQPMSLSSWEPDQSNWGIALTKALDTFFPSLHMQYDSVRMLGIMDPIQTYLAIPDEGDPGTLTITLTFPEGAVSARLYGSGFGFQGSDPHPGTIFLATLFTALFNLGIPAIFLALAAQELAQETLFKSVEKSAAEDNMQKFVKFLKEAAQEFLPGLVEQGVTSGSIAPDLSKLYDIGKFIFDEAAEPVIVWMAAQISAEEAVDEIPFVGWAIAAMNIAVDIAQIGETMGEIISSPWQITNTISTSINTNVTIHPDPRNQAFPQGSSPSYTFKAIYQNDKRRTVVKHEAAIGNPIRTQFRNKLGGHVKFELDFFTEDKLAGKAVSGWMLNTEANTAQVTLYLVEFPVPLTSDTDYHQLSQLEYAGGHYQWALSGNAPTQTRNSIRQGITLSQRHGKLGWCWAAYGTPLTNCGSGQSGQNLYLMQSLDIPGAEGMRVKSPQCGYATQTNIIYDPYPAKFEMGANGKWVMQGKYPKPDPNSIDLGAYYVDPTYAIPPPSEPGAEYGSGYHLRKIDLDSSGSVNPGGVSCGRFPSNPDPSKGNAAQIPPPDSVAIHPSGYAVAVNSKTHKLYIVKLELNGVPDIQAPMALSYAGSAQNPYRPGLLADAIAVTCTSEGTILVLEDLVTIGSNEARIQAFNLDGSLVPFFANHTSFPLAKTNNRRYLDIATVGGHKQTYIYVLFYEGEGAQIENYQIEIYRFGPQIAYTTSPFITKVGVAAAKLAVDMWHTVYTLNYKTVSGTSNQVPSLSEWTPR